MQNELTHPNAQTSKSLQTQCNQKLQKTLDLSKNIISGKAQLPFIEMGLTMKDTFQGITIRSAFREEAGQIGYSVINLLVRRFVDSFGFATKMNETQIEVLSVDTMEKFSYETLEDVILFFKMARTGQFGTTMRGVDSNLIFGDWYIKYLEIKAEHREKDYEKTKIEQKTELVSLEDVRKSYHKQKNTGKKFIEKVIERINEITQDFTRKDLEKLISEWNKDTSKKDFIQYLKRKRLDIK